MRGKNSIFWGIILILGAVVLLVNKMGYLEGISLGTILLNIGLAAILIKGLFRRSFGTILFSLAFLVIVNDELLHLEAITPWPVLGAALLGTIGLDLLFPGFKYGRKFPPRIGNRSHWRSGGTVDCNESNGGVVSFDNVFGSAVKYVSGVVSFVGIDNVFGSMEVYFTDATLLSNNASVTVDLVFGEVTLYVPASWKVERKTENIFASTDESGRAVRDGENVLYVGGSVVFGHLEIVYV
ncbi:MAG: hypothetical protein HFH87_14095 [Lachnospiraceae bacterium]|nr:hypothetical protein [Lachnospiraceae bacterium]